LEEGLAAKTTGRRLLAMFVGVAALVAAAVIASFATAARTGALDDVSWPAIAGVSGVIGGIATVGAAGAIGFTAVEFDRRSIEAEQKRQDEQRRERISRRP
jgi:hypothetical protein